MEAPVHQVPDMTADSIVYDGSTRFFPVYIGLDSGRSMSRFLVVYGGLLEAPAIWISCLPAPEISSTLVRAVTAEALRSVLAASRHSEVIKFKHQSLFRGRRAILDYTLDRSDLDVDLIASRPQVRKITVQEPKAIVLLPEQLTG